MNFQDHFPHSDHYQHRHTFQNEGWAIGKPPSFEVELAAFDGNGAVEESKCVREIQQLRSDSDRLGALRVYSPRLYRRIFDEDASRLIPSSESGMTAASLHVSSASL